MKTDKEMVKELVLKMIMVLLVLKMIMAELA